MKSVYPPFRRFSSVIAQHFFDDLDSDVQNPVGPNVQSHQYSRSNELRSEYTPPPISTMFVCYSKSFFGDLDFDVQNDEIFFGRPSWPWLFRRLPRISSPTNIQGQMSSKVRIRLPFPIFQWFSYAIGEFFFGDLDSDLNKEFFFGCSSRPW